MYPYQILNFNNFSPSSRFFILSIFWSFLKLFSIIYLCLILYIPLVTFINTNNINGQICSPPKKASSPTFCYISSSYSCSLLRKVSTSVDSSSAGTKLSIGTSSILMSKPHSLAKMTTFRCTSLPDRSSLGSGSVYPRSLAVRTTWLQGVVPSYVLKRYDRVPEKTPKDYQYL